MAKFIVEPQRSNGIAFINCDISRATSFAVFKVTVYRHKKYFHFQSRHQTRTQAEGAASSQNLSAAGPLRRYALGKRMEKRV